MLGVDPPKKVYVVDVNVDVDVDDVDVDGDAHTPYTHNVPTARWRIYVCIYICIYTYIYI